MTTNIEDVNVLDKIYQLASNSDGVVILTYSLNSDIVHEILSKLKPPKEFRIMYSAKTRAQKNILQLKNMEKNCKALEISSGTDHFETSHAKIYLFCSTDQKFINLTAILGSFNLTFETLTNIEIYGVYKYQVDRKFLEKTGIRHFLEIFDLDGNFKVDLKILKKNVSGEDAEIGYEILLLLLQLWFKDIPILSSNLNFENINFFGEENKRMFVSTLGNNTLLAGLQSLLKSAFIYADERGEEVELTIVTPFHTEEVLERLFLLKDQILESNGLKGKIKFSLRLLTNSFNVSGDVDRSSFTNPLILRKMMFNSEHSHEFKVKFWGYMPGNEDFIHAKIYVIKVGEKKALLVTSANLTLSGFGFELQKNLEVGVIENQPERIEELCRWVDECWNSEYSITSENDRIWSELQNWYDRLKEIEEMVEEDFEIQGLTDFYIYEKNKLKVKDKKNREIECVKLLMSFAKKEKPVKNLEEAFKKEGDCFCVEFTLREEHLGPVFCDIIARLTDGTYIFVAQQKVNVLEKFPDISINFLPEVDVPKNFINGMIPVEIKIETGKGISKIDLTKVLFELKAGREKVTPKIFLIKEKLDRVRILQFLLWANVFEVAEDLYLDLFYENEKKATCKIPQEFVNKSKAGTIDKKIANFLNERSIRLLTDERTLCPKVESEFELNFDLDIIKSFGIDRIMVIRDFSYSELIGMKKIRRQIVEEFQFSEKIKVSNNFQSNPPTDIETWVYGVKRDEWTWFVPVGKINYQLLKNPPDLEFKEETRIKTNVTPVKIDFNLKGPEIFRDQIIFNCRIGEWENSFSTKSQNIRCTLPQDLDLEKLKKGMDIEYRLTFKYKIADIIGKIHINYNFFVSFPHPSDSTKIKMLIYDRERPHKLLDIISTEIPKDRRPFLTIVPTSSTNFKEFHPKLNEDLEETNACFVRVEDGTFVLRKLGQRALSQLKSRNFANLQITIGSENHSQPLIIPFDVLYLEGIKTDCVTMRMGGYGKTITIYYPDNYEDEFKEDIIRIVREIYPKYLEIYHLKKEKDEEIIKRIKDFIEKVKTENFVPIFKSRKDVLPYEAQTLPERRVIDFILFIRRINHELEIRINEW